MEFAVLLQWRKKKLKFFGDGEKWPGPEVYSRPGRDQVSKPIVRVAFHDSRFEASCEFRSADGVVVRVEEATAASTRTTKRMAPRGRGIWLATGYCARSASITRLNMQRNIRMGGHFATLAATSRASDWNNGFFRIGIPFRTKLDELA
jgi:hypothetical protein